MDHKGKWGTIGVGLELVAPLMMLIDPLLAIPPAILGATLILYGLCPRIFKADVGRLHNPYIPLKDAARIAYEKTLNTSVSAMAERLGKDSGGTLSYYAIALIQDSPDSPVQIFGTRPPSTKLEAIPHNKVRAWRFSDDLTALESRRREFENLQVRRRDLTRKIKEIQSWAGKIVDG